MSDRPAIDVRVEQLVLTGLDAAAGERIGASLRGELERIVSAGDRWPAATGDLAFVRAGAVELPRGSSAEVVGREIARAVYDGLAR